MNVFEISKKWFDWCFDNASKVKPIHTALLFFIIDQNNRLGWKQEFGLPRQMAMDAIGVKNNRTFTSAFNDLENWGFITVLERSKNQYSANIISIFGCVKNTPATTKALTKATQNHSQKQRIGIAPINKLKNLETINDDDVEKKTATNVLFKIERCKEEYLANKKIVKAVCENPKNNISENEIEDRLTEFNQMLLETGKHLKEFEDYCSHFLAWHKKNKKSKIKFSTNR